jgi:oligosaccharide repeat unit polymerase
MNAVNSETQILPRSRLQIRKFPIYPALGLVGCLIGTSIAVDLMPPDPFPAGALFASALVMTAGLLVAPALACVNNPRAIFRAEHILVLSPVYWILSDLLQGAYPLEEVSKEAIINSFWAICLFVCGVWIAAIFRPLPLPTAINRASSYAVEPKTLFKLVLILFSLSFLRFAIPSNFDPIAMVQGLTVARWNAPWTRGQLGGWDSFLDHMAYFGYALPTITVLISQKTGWLNWRVLVSGFLSLLITAFLAQGGGRRIVGVVIGAAIISWILQQKMINTRKLLIVGAWIALLLIVMQLMLISRNSGIQETLAGEEKQLQYDYLHVDDNFLRLAQIIDIVPQEHPYIYEKQIVFILIRPIPRVFWEGKPIDPGFDLPTLLGKKGVSLSSSAIGEFYLIMGMFAVFLGGLFYGLLAHMFSVLLLRLQGSSSVLVYSLATMALLAGMRSMQELILMSYALLAWVAISRFVFRWMRRRKQNT